MESPFNPISGYYPNYYGLFHIRLLDWAYYQVYSIMNKLDRIIDAE
ncbi:hypothetical protein J8281_04545 [Aquimarina sp. U1-2]|nr:hypothetical protein [Aquimarina sp. U1-2]MBP2831450.1 hypothetical protein [Aquimarina sp. U1-2]